MEPSRPDRPLHTVEELLVDILGAGAGGHRMQMTFSDEAWQDLSRPGKTPAERLRDGIALLRWMDERERAGDRVMVARRGRFGFTSAREVRLK